MVKCARLLRIALNSVANLSRGWQSLIFAMLGPANLDICIDARIAGTSSQLLFQSDIPCRGPTSALAAAAGPRCAIGAPEPEPRREGAPLSGAAPVACCCGKRRSWRRGGRISSKILPAPPCLFSTGREGRGLGI